VPRRPRARLAALVDEALAVRVTQRDAAAYGDAVGAWRRVLERLKTIDRARLGLDDQVDYAKLLLREYVPEAVVEDPGLKVELLAAAGVALAAVEDFERWLRADLLPRSTRSPAWKPAEIEFYQFVHEQLDEYGVDEMIRIAAEEERRLTAEMTELARRIHPSGDLRTAWEVMKEEAPPTSSRFPTISTTRRGSRRRWGGARCRSAARAAARRWRAASRATTCSRRSRTG